ncbi:MAG: DUF512 domain-containing protein [Clostridia bacterium]|nr:DUF512 domain-containing protein [Clostridia bacterium]
MKYRARVKSVAEGSIAEEAGIVPGDIIATVNSNKINDELDFRFYALDDYLEILVIKENGDKEYIEVEYPDSPNLGIEFESALMGSAQSCANNCIFCFIDQLPCGMRDTLYFKDDDSRLSFLNGNYVTLTNIGNKSLDKIIKMRLDPINISVHTTNPELRRKMLKNKHAGDIMKHIKKLYDGKIHMNCQIVLVGGVNDKAELDRSIGELSEYYPYITSVSVVPVGITKFREGLYPLKPFTADECKSVIEQVNGWQKRLKEKIGTNFIYAADEFYIKSGTPIPPEEEYEGYPQIENGVGLIRSTTDEFMDAIADAPPEEDTEVTIVTGVAAYPTIKSLADAAMEKYPAVKIDVKKVENKFFGEHITVAGLLTGQDILNTLKNEKIYKRVLIPDVMLKSGTQLFLDDMTVEELEAELDCKIEAAGCDGYSLWDKIKGGKA